MATATHGTASNYLQRAPSPSSLADVVDLILDKGLVIDAYVRATRGSRSSASARRTGGMRSSVQGDAKIARLREQTRDAGGADPRQLQLGEAVARALTARRARDVGAIEKALRPLATDAVAEELRTELELLRASYLVEQRKIPAFDKRMDELAAPERERIAFTYTGPLPPHSFVGLSHRRSWPVGLLTGLLLLPLAPVRGTIWVAETLAEEAARRSDRGCSSRPSSRSTAAT